MTKQALESQNARKQHKERVCMTEKVTNVEDIRPRRSVELRELALAAFYPQSHSGTGPTRKRIEGSPSVIVDKEMQ